MFVFYYNKIWVIRLGVPLLSGTRCVQVSQALFISQQRIRGWRTSTNAGTQATAIAVSNKVLFSNPGGVSSASRGEAMVG